MLDRQKRPVLGPILAVATAFLALTANKPTVQAATPKGIEQILPKDGLEGLKERRDVRGLRNLIDGLKKQIDIIDKEMQEMKSNIDLAKKERERISRKDFRQPCRDNVKIFWTKRHEQILTK